MVGRVDHDADTGHSYHSHQQGSISAEPGKLAVDDAFNHGIRSLATLLSRGAFTGVGTPTRDVLANSLAYTCRLYRPYARCEGLFAANEMDID